MRLVAYSAGRWALVPMSATRVYSKLEVEMLLTERMAGRSEVSLDFSGQFVPVSLTEEVPLVASLLTAYHNSVVMANIQDPTYTPYVAPVEDGTEDEYSTADDEPSSEGEMNEDLGRAQNEIGEETRATTRHR